MAAVFVYIYSMYRGDGDLCRAVDAALERVSPRVHSRRRRRRPGPDAATWPPRTAAGTEISIFRARRSPPLPLVHPFLPRGRRRVVFPRAPWLSVVRTARP